MQGGNFNFTPSNLVDFRLAPPPPPADMPLELATQLAALILEQPAPGVASDDNALDASRTSLEALRGDQPGAPVPLPPGALGPEMPLTEADLEAQILALMGQMAPGSPAGAAFAGAPTVASPTQPFTNAQGFVSPGVPAMPGLGTTPFNKSATLPLSPPKPVKKKGGFFSKIGGALKKVGKVVAKALPVVTTVACFVPGLNAIALPMKIATMASKAITAVNAIKSGNWLGAVMAVAPGVGGKVGDMVTRFQSSGLGRAFNVARNAYSGYRQGGLAGALAGGAASFAPTGGTGAAAQPGRFASFLSNAGSVALGYRNGGLAGALGAAGQVAGGRAGDAFGTAASAWSNIRSGNFAGALAALRDGGALGSNPAFNARLDQAGGALNVINATRQGDFMGAFRAFQASIASKTQKERAASDAQFQATMALRHGDPRIEALAQRLAPFFRPGHMPAGAT